MGMIYRCDTCGRLLTERQADKGECLGHRMRYASYGTLGEWITIKFRVKILEPLQEWMERRSK